MDDGRQQVIGASVRQFIVDNFLYVRPNYVFSDTDSLFGQGIVDSFGAAELIAYLEEQFGIVIEDAEVTEQNLGSVRAIAEFVLGKMPVRGTATTGS